jgi:uncharacterized protein YjbI with pentapeptide repeats
VTRSVPRDSSFYGLLMRVRRFFVPRQRKTLPPGRPASRGGRWVTLVFATAVLTVAVAWVLFVPAADWLARHDVGAVTGPALATARDAARGRLLTLGAGVLAAGALVFTARSFGLSREGQVTDRYTKAIEQLGSEKLDVRIGGIYALERIAFDSARDHPTVVEVLTAFIREHSREAWEPADFNGPAENRPPRPDIQAATTVIARRDHTRDIRPLDLSRANLNYAKFRNVSFTHANLTKAMFFAAEVSFADFTGVDLSGANIASAVFFDVRLVRASLHSADLTGTSFRKADLTSAQLALAKLARSEFIETSFKGANLARADFAHADLARADLSGAIIISTDLSNAELPLNLGGVDLGGADLTGAKMPTSGTTPSGWELNVAGRLVRKHRGSAGSPDS